MDWGDIAGNTGFQIGYPILNALLAGVSPRGYRAAQGLNIGLGIANRLAEQNKADTQDELLRQKLGDVFKAQDQTPAATLPGSTTNLGLASEEAAGLQALNDEGKPPESTAATTSFSSLTPQPTEIAPATSKPVFTPQQQKLGEALIQARRPDLALGIISKELFKEPQRPSSVRPGGALVDANGNVIYQAPNAPARPVTPPRPVVGEYGIMIPTKDQNTGEWTWPSAPTPAQPAPPRQLSPEAKALEDAKLKTEQARPGLIGAQTAAAREEADLRKRRRKDLEDAANDINNPKTDKNRLTTVYSGLLRRYDQLTKADPQKDNPEEIEDYQDLQNVKALIRSAEHRLQKEGGLTGNPAPPAKPRLKFDAQGNPK